MGDLAKPALILRIQEKMDQLKKGKFRFNKEDLKIIKDILKNKNLNQGGTVMKTKKYRGGGQGYAAREDESLGNAYWSRTH